MKVKLGKILEDKLNLISLSKEKLPIKVSYWIKRICDKCDTEIYNFEELRLKLIKELGSEQKDKSFKVEKENEDKFFEEIKKLQEVEVELVGVNTIKLSELGNIQIEPSKLISWIFIE